MTHRKFATPPAVEDRSGDRSPSSTPNSRGRGRAPLFVRVVVLLCAAFMLTYGAWAMVSPRSFMRSIDFSPYNGHLVHDAGAFQVGLGVALLVAALGADGSTVALGGFATASALHTLSHFWDRNVGGHDSDVPLLATVTLLAVVALVVHLRRRTP